jgi:hypothetical protein
MVSQEEKKKKIILNAINKNSLFDKFMQNIYSNTFLYLTLIFVLTAFAYIIILMNITQD